MRAIKNLIISIFRKLPFSWQVALSRGRSSLGYYIKTERRELVVDYYLGKYSICVDTSNDVERRFLSGSYEEDTLAIIRKLVRPGDTCLDIGANVGAVSIALADQVGSSGKVYAFEPGPGFQQRLQANLRLNPKLSSIVVPDARALSNANAKLKWQMSTTAHGTATTYVNGMDSSAPVIEVEAIRMDDHATLKELGRLNFIKLDVDGLEYEILQGGLETLKKHLPSIYYETNMWNEEMKVAALNIEKFLVGLGYEIFKVEPSTYDLIPTKYPDYTFNTVAIPVDNLSTRMRSF